MMMGLPSVQVAPPGGSEVAPLLITPFSGASVGAWPAANQGIHVKFQVEKERTVTGLRIGVGAASGAAKAGLFLSNGTALTQMALSASTNVAGANVTQDILFTVAQKVSPFLVYTALLTLDNNAATILRTTVGSGGFVTFGAFDISYAVVTQFVTPTTPLTLSGLTGGASGYTPILALI